MEKPLETARVGPQVGCGSISGNHQGRANSQDDRDSGMLQACLLWSGRAQQRNNGLCQHFCLGESCPFSLLPRSHTIQFLSVSGSAEQLLRHCSSQGVSRSKPVCGPFKRNCLGLQSPPPSHSATILTGFYSQRLW